MEFLTTITQNTHVGYPLIFFYLVAVVGIILVIFRPYWAFLFAFFCLAARNFHAAVFTRTPFAGPYLNLNDLLLWITLFAMVFELIRTRKMVWMPKILFAIFILIIIGDIVSLFKYGTEGFVLRRIWSTAIFPILFLISANIVKNEKRAKLFYWVFFVGAVFAAIQHMIFIKSVTSGDMFVGITEIRIISYTASGGLFLIISAIFVKPDKALNRFRLISYYVGIALIALSYILSLTRGIYVVGILTLVVFPFLLRGKYTIIKGAYKFAIGVFLVLFLVQILSPNFDFKGILNQRFKSFITKDAFSRAYTTRLVGQKTELDLWTNGIIIFGEGSSLPPEYESAEPEITGALYHVAYSTYLAHYGLVGLFLYGFLLPISTILAARKYYFKYTMSYGGKIALIAIACALFDVFSLPTSRHYLFATSHMPGLIYGAIWGLYRSMKVEKRAIAFYKYRQPALSSSPVIQKYGN